MAQLNITDYLRGIRKTAADVVTGKNKSITSAAGRALNPTAVRQNVQQLQSGIRNRNLADILQGGGSTLANVAATALAARGAGRLPLPAVTQPAVSPVARAASPALAALQRTATVVPQRALDLARTRPPIESFFLRPAAETAVKTAPAAASSGAKALLSGRTQVLGGAAALAPAAVATFEQLTGREVPGVVQRAAGVAGTIGGIVTGSAGKRRMAQEGVSGIRRAAALAQRVAGAGTALTGLSFLTGAESAPAPAVETTAAQVVPAPQAPAAAAPTVEDLPSQADVAQAQLDAAKNNLAAGYQQESGAADEAYNAALQNLLNTYGADAATQAATDPVLAQELQAINASYAQAQQAIDANYAAALGQVEDYQAQVNATLQNLAAAQLAGIETAAGQATAPAPGAGLTAEQAAAAGVSPTAVGGAGITGGVLTRALGGVSAAQLAAEQVGAGTILGETLAGGALDRAAVQAALAQSRTEAERGARVTAAERQARERAQARQDRQQAAAISFDAAAQARRAEQDLASRLLELQYNADVAFADRIATMSPQEFNKWRSGGSKAPVARPVGRFASTNPALGDLSPANITGAPAVTVNDANIVMESLELQAQDILLSGRTPTEAKNDLAGWYSRMAGVYEGGTLPAILKAQGLPTTPSTLAEYFFQAPQS